MTKDSVNRKKNKGFTMTETLVALAILVFFGSIVTVGVNAALKTYRQMVYMTNCRVLGDDINTAFGGLIRSSSYIKLESSGDVYFKSNQYSATYGFGRLVVSEETKDDGKKSCQLYLLAEDTRNKEYADCPLVSPRSYENMTLENVKMTYANEGNNVVFTLSYTISSMSGDKKRDYECKYRTVNTKKIDGYEKSSATEITVPIVSQSSTY